VVEIEENELIKERLSLIICECGSEILLLPDLRVMSHAIEVHVAEHRKKELNPAEAETTARRIRNLLIGQILKKAGETKH
jgi:hypothetical protein